VTREESRAGRKESVVAELMNAEMLAAFADLELDRVGGFREDNPDFLPSSWWAGPAWNEGFGTYTPWLRERDLLRQCWAKGFPADKTLELVSSNLFLIARTLTFDSAEEINNAPQKIWPYQRAVLFLHINTWRAKVCHVCKRRFIAGSKIGKYCGNHCSASVVRESHRKSFHKNKDKWPSQVARQSKRKSKQPAIAWLPA
jgi:hypothetical protein